MPAKRPFVNPFEITGQWYKANLHTHTTHSDGRLSPADRVAQYIQGGYDVIALTDHGKVNTRRGLGKGKILVVNGMECHPEHPTHKHAYHLVALNVKPSLKHQGLSANALIRKVRAAGGEVVLAHPYWCGYQFEDYRELKGLAAIEVFNGTCQNGGRGCSESEWAHGLERKMLLPAVAVDDAHSADGHDVFQGWTWLKMTRPTVANVLKAVRTGACYASTGPKIHDFRVENQRAIVRCSPAARIDIISIAPHGALIKAPKGKTIRHFDAACTKDWWGKGLPFVRARVTDTEGNRAWTNPIWL